MTIKQTFSVVLSVMLSVAMVSCESESEKQIDRDLTRLGVYLDSVEAATPVYTEQAWDNIQAEYNNTIAKIDVGGKEMSKDANTKLEAVKADYNKLKVDYNSHIASAKEQAANSYKTNLRKDLFGGEQIGDDKQFNFVTAQNALSVYDRFVTTVKNNKNEYSREDWDEIKVLYEALDNRKNEIEKDLATSDNLKIAKHKIQFASIQAVKRPASKIGENEDAKN
jgi:hypothetical protein